MFCVYLTIYKGKLLPPFYIGRAPISKIEKGYRGSVRSKSYRSVWESELKENPHMFSTYILFASESSKEVGRKEEKLQRLLNVHRNPLYINRNINGELFTAPEKHSEETKRKMSEADRSSYKRTKPAWNKGKKMDKPAWNKGISPSEEVRRKLSEAAKNRTSPRKGRKFGPRSEEAKSKTAATRAAREYTQRRGYTNPPHTTETKAKISEANGTPVEVYGVRYNSLSHARKALKIGMNKLKRIATFL